MQSPLKDLRILDFTHLLPGQIAAGILSDMGARILHIEPPEKLSLAHQLPPIINGESLYFWVLHKRKSRLAVDLKNDLGRQVIVRMIANSDVVLENFRPGVMKRLGLDYETVRELNKNIIYCSISGYGQKTAQKDKAAHDLNLIAETGILNLNRREDLRPVLPSIPISDYMSGMLSVISILSCLHQRDNTGEGEHIDISMLDSALSSLNILSAMSLYTEKEPEEGGFAYPRELPNYNTYRCKDDRYLAVASIEPKFFKEFLDLIDRPDLLKEGLEERYLFDEIGKEIEAKTLSQWREIFADSNCCVSPVNTVSEALTHFPLSERNMLHTLEHPTLGAVPQVKFPVSDKLRDVERDSFSVEGSDQAYSMLLANGYSEKEIADLKSQGIISLYQAN